MRIGLYGGSFNPIHHGHLIVARAVAETARLDRVILLPSRTPPHKVAGDLLNPEHRAEMVRLAVAGDPLFSVSDVDMTRDGPTYTIDTVLHFRRALGDSAELFWLIGGDSFRDLISWRRLPDLVDACTILTAARAGYVRVDWAPFHALLDADAVRRLQDGILATPVIEISSTDIRRRLTRGESIRYLTPEAVCDYIAAQKLYAEK